jgi:hypothetical protein
MAYQTGAASSTTDVLQKLVTWLVSLGWHQDRSAVEGSGWTASLDLHGNFVHLRACENESSGIWNALGSGAGYQLGMYMSSAFNGSNAFKDQPTGAPISSGHSYAVGVAAHLSVGPFSNYYFFADGTADNIVVVIEKTPGLYVYVGWGASLLKSGAFTGGQYFFGSCGGYFGSDTFVGANVPGYTSTSDCPGTNQDGIGAAMAFVRADVDSFTGQWLAVNSGAVTGGDQGYTGKNADTSVKGLASAMRTNFPVYAYRNASDVFQYMQTSQQDARANLLPVFLWAQRDGTATGFSLLGSIPNVFCSNAVGNGYSNADEYVLGGTTYKLFPNFAVVKQ